MKSLFTSTHAYIIALVLIFSASSAIAHDDETLDKMKAPHDGQVRMAGIYHFELLMNKNSQGNKEEPLTVFVTDHNWNKIETKGATATATILSGKTKSTITLIADEDNGLTGMAKYVAKPDLKVVLSVTMSGKSVEQARYTPFKTMKMKTPQGKHGTHEH